MKVAWILLLSLVIVFMLQESDAWRRRRRGWRVRIRTPRIRRIRKIVRLPRVRRIVRLPRVRRFVRIPRVRRFVRIPRVRRFVRIPRVRRFVRIPRVRRFVRIPRVRRFVRIPRFRVRLPRVRRFIRLPRLRRAFRIRKLLRRKTFRKIGRILGKVIKVAANKIILSNPKLYIAKKIYDKYRKYKKFIRKIRKYNRNNPKHRQPVPKCESQDICGGVISEDWSSKWYCGNICELIDNRGRLHWPGAGATVSCNFNDYTTGYGYFEPWDLAYQLGLKHSDDSNIKVFKKLDTNEDIDDEPFTTCT